MAKETGKETAGGERERDAALFKFSLIAPVVAGTFTQAAKMDYYREACEKEHRLPDGRTVKLSPLTLKKWYWLYTDGGLEALLPKARSDQGMPRVLSEDVCGQILAYRKHFPHITGKKIYELLVKDGYMKKEDASLDSVYRYLKAAGLEKGGMGQKECLAFEFGHANDCWQADTTFGPTVLEGKKHRQTYLGVRI